MVQTDFAQVDQTHFVTSLAHADAINHIVVFLTGLQPFPDGFAGAVYFSFPSPDAAPSWQYLGHIGNEKPSAIFRITKWKPSSSDMITPLGFANAPAPPPDKMAQIGISVETLDQIKALTPADNPSSTTQAPTDAFVEFVKKMLDNFVDFAASFGVQPSSQSQSLNPNESYVPSSVVQKWYDNFLRRLNVNPYFWRT